MSAFATFLLALGRGSRRVLTVGQPYCAGLTTDEEHMLRLVAAAQTGDAMLLWAHLAWLARREHQADVKEAANSLSEALTEVGVVLPQVRMQVPPRRASLDLVTAH